MKRNPSTQQKTALQLIEQQLPQFANTIVGWNKGHSGLLDDDQWNDILIGCDEMLREIWEYFTLCTVRPNRWDSTETHHMGDVFFLSSFTQDSGLHMTLGMSKEAFYLEMTIQNEKNIHRMPDSFWKSFLALGDLGILKFNPNEVLSSEVMRRHPKLHEDKPSQLFMLLRNLISYEIANDHMIELGNIEVGWPFDTFSIKEVVHNGAMAIVAFDQLNSLLMHPKRPR